MQAGDVLFFKDFIFKDGGQSDKLILILNTPTNNEPYLLCPTTSQQHRRKQQLGCHSNENYFYIDERQDNFVKNTWLVFHNVYAKDKTELDKKSIPKFSLNSTLWEAIKNCVLASNDIEIDYLEMINKS